MSMLGGLFSGREQHPNFERIAHALHNHLGLNVVSPPAEVLAIIDQVTTRELLHFDNMQSMQGMQELFKAKSVRVSVDAATSTVTLSLASAGEITAEEQTEHAHKPGLQIGTHHAAFHIERPKDPVGTIKASLAAARPAEALAPLAPAFEHLEAFEQLVPHVIDLFVRHGRLNTADKEVLRKIRPLESTLEARLTALERWRAEMTRRIRGMSVPKVAQHLNLSLGGGRETQAAGSEEMLARRFNSIQVWTSKLIKAFEHEGVKFHNKPMWLPH
jgi:hypothetical protein